GRLPRQSPLAAPTEEAKHAHSAREERQRTRNWRFGRRVLPASQAGKGLSAVIRHAAKLDDDAGDQQIRNAGDHELALQIDEGAVVLYRAVKVGIGARSDDEIARRSAAAVVC